MDSVWIFDLRIRRLFSSLRCVRKRGWFFLFFFRDFSVRIEVERILCGRGRVLRGYLFVEIGGSRMYGKVEDVVNESRLELL